MFPVIKDRKFYYPKTLKNVMDLTFITFNFDQNRNYK